MKNKITLKQYKSSDLNKHVSLLVMNKIYKMINKKVEEKEEKWLKKVTENYKKEKPDFFVLAIFLNKKNLIGNIIIEKINYSKKTGSIGYWVGKQYQKKGYITNALKLFLKKMNKTLKIKKVFAETNLKNIASSKVLEKNAFTQIKKRKNILYWEKRLK